MDNTDGSDSVGENSIANHSITDESIFYVTIFVFTLLTSVLPAILGQSWFLPLGQTASLTIFAGLLLRRRRVNRALAVIAGWMVIQFGLIVLLTMGFPTQLERAIPDGFMSRVTFIEWFYAGSPPPPGWIEGPVSRLFQSMVVAAGSLLTGGLIGTWILVRSVNQAGFYSGSLLMALNETFNAFGAWAPWTVLRLAGTIGLTVYFAEPILSGDWSIRSRIRERGSLLLSSLFFILLGIIVEMILPGWWRATFS